MLSKWLENRRVARDSRDFWAFVECGETQNALEIFRVKLNSKSISRELRAAGLLLRWVSDRDEKDYRALEKLAQNSPIETAVGQSWLLVTQMRRLLQFAQEVRNLVQGKNLTGQIPSIEARGLLDCSFEFLAGAILDSRIANRGAHFGEQEIEAARRIVRRTQVGQTTTVGREIRARLFVWAAFLLHEYKSVLEDQGLKQDLGQALAKTARLAAAHAWAHRELARRNLKEALLAIREIDSEAGPEILQQLVMMCGASLLEHDHELAREWFSAYRGHSGLARSEPWQIALAIGEAVAHCASADYSGAQQVFQTILKREPSGGHGAGGTLEIRLRGEIHYLCAVSYVASTHHWNQAGPADQDQRIKNRSLWATLRPQLERMISSLIAAGPETAWRGHFLVGLVAYVDSTVSLDLPTIDQFSASVDRQTTDARAKLKTIQGTLAARAKATEEAIHLIQNNRFHQLADLKQVILDKMGGSIPPLVRASICMTIWIGNPDYDPLPELKALLQHPGIEHLISQCIAQVELVQAVGKLRRMCLDPASATEIVPSSEALAGFDAGMGQLAALAGAVIYLRRCETQLARRLIEKTIEYSSQEKIVFIRFYIAWKNKNADECQALLNSTHAGWITSLPGSPKAVKLMALLNALEQQGANSWELFLALAETKEVKSLQLGISRLVLWLLEQRRPNLASNLLKEAKHRFLEGLSAPSPQHISLDWMCLVLWTFITAQAGQYATCVDTASRLLSMNMPELAAFGKREADRQMIAWVRLLMIEAELASVAHLQGDAKAQWHSMERVLKAHSEELSRNPFAQPYVCLIQALTLQLSAETQIDDEVLSRLEAAQQELPMKKHAGYLQDIVAKANWRKKIIEVFWNYLSVYDFNGARRTFQQELLVVYRGGVPEDIQLAMVIVEAEGPAETTDSVLLRFENFRKSARKSKPELIERLRNYIIESGHIRHLIHLLKEQQFQKLIEQIDGSTWIGLKPGSMPLTVAIARLYSCLKIKRTEDVLRMGEQIRSGKNFESWTTNYGSLLLGYALFDQQKYPEASVAFEGITESNVLGHDTDKYWAASKFNHGLQLLKVDQKEKAFEVFAESLSKAVHAHPAGDLAPLCAHFALKSFETRDGMRARESFTLLQMSLEMIDDSFRRQSGIVAVQMGLLLCQALMDEDVDELDGERFLQLSAQLTTCTPQTDQDSKMQVYLEHSLRILAICQELRRRVRMPPSKQTNKSKLADFLQKQVAPLEMLNEKLHRHDPVLLVLRGLTSLRLSRGQEKQAINSLDAAVRLGLQSQKLTTLLGKEREAIKRAGERYAAALTLFDLYLSDGSIPKSVTDKVIGTDSVSLLYKVGRNCDPRDMVSTEVQSGTALLCLRMERLRKFVDVAQVNGDPALKEFDESIRKLTAALKKTEEQLLEKERKMMGHLAALLQSQTIDEEALTPAPERRVNEH
jgi:hypothetical protein